MYAYAEPTLQPLTGETLTGASAITEDGARLDIAASGFWGGHHLMSECITPMPPRIGNPSPPATCRKHENIKKRAYEQRVREIERGSSTPLVLSLTEGLGNAATVCFKRLASMLATKRDQPYSTTMAWLRCCLSFCLLRSSIRAVSGAPAPPMDAPPSNPCLQLTSSPWREARLRT